jgi:hypothetical protein
VRHNHIICIHAALELLREVDFYFLFFVGHWGYLSLIMSFKTAY